MAKRARALRHQAAGKTTGDERNILTPDEPDHEVVHADSAPHADEAEGAIRDPVMWNGRIVSYVKEVSMDDPEWDPNVRKVMLKPLGEAPVRVPASEIHQTVAPREPETRTVDRRPSKFFPAGHPGNLVPDRGRVKGDKL